MKRAPIVACVAVVLSSSIAMTAVAQSKSSHHPVSRTVSAEGRVAASDVRIEPTKQAEGSTSIDIGADHWVARGYDLKTLLSEIFDVDMRRIEISGEDSTDARYDVALTLAHEVDDDVMQRMLVDALEQKFRISIAPEDRSMDVYVLTAPNGPGAGLHRHESTAGADNDVEEIEFLGKKCDGVSSGGITASAGTLGEFRRTLEPDLDRLLVDETGLKGNYDFQIGSYDNQSQLFKLLHDKLGIVVTPEQRNVSVLTIRPAQEMRAAL